MIAEMGRIFFSCYSWGGKISTVAWMAMKQCLKDYFSHHVFTVTTFYWCWPQSIWGRIIGLGWGWVMYSGMDGHIATKLKNKNWQQKIIVQSVRDCLFYFALAFTHHYLYWPSRQQCWFKLGNEMCTVVRMVL